MICLTCFQPKTAVVNSRQHKKQSSVWRRRRCRSCKTVFTTYEKPLLDDLIVTDASAHQPFQSTKLLLSIAQCFEHQPQKRAEYADALTDTIVRALIQTHTKHIITKELVATIAYPILRRFDHRAAIQYAARHSHYLEKYL